MTLSMYCSLVPPLVSSLGNLRHLLVQAEGHAEAHGYDATVLLDSRLYPDMFPLKRQVQIASDIAKKGGGSPCWPGSTRDGGQRGDGRRTPGTD